MTVGHIYVRLISERRKDMASLAQKEAQKRYDAKNRRKFTINLNYNTDADLIAYIESWDNIQRGFKQLLWRELGRISKRKEKI